MHRLTFAPEIRIVLPVSRLCGQFFLLSYERDMRYFKTSIIETIIVGLVQLIGGRKSMRNLCITCILRASARIRRMRKRLAKTEDPFNHVRGRQLPCESWRGKRIPVNASQLPNKMSRSPRSIKFENEFVGFAFCLLDCQKVFFLEERVITVMFVVVTVRPMPAHDYQYQLHNDDHANETTYAVIEIFFSD